MSKKLANDCVAFPGDAVTSFTQALASGQQFLQSSPQSSFQIIYNSQTSQVELQLERVSVRSDFPSLFGPGDVPGYLSEEDMQAITELVSMLPQNGLLVEIGTFLGKSAVEWAKNIQQQSKDYKIICIDSFNSPIEILRDLLQEAEFTIPEADSQLTMFKHYTKEFSSVQPLEAFFDKDFEFNQTIDLVFEDSDHSQRALNYALPFWWQRIRPGGILSGHDYWGREIKTAVDTFAVLNGLTVKTFAGSSIWYIEK